MPDEAATLDFARRFAGRLDSGGVIYLQGDLGAGKTCLVRGLLRGLGYGERVVSPTYTLIEPYILADGRKLFHLDLYRIAEPEELALLGLRDIHPEQDLMLVEWPGQGKGFLPEPDLTIQLRDHESGPGRQLGLIAASDRGRAWLESG